MNENPRRLSPERRARILDAARHLILRQGLRATTMEAVAREARIAKPTLYGYFPDKQALFGALVHGLAEDIRAAIDRAFQGEGDAVDRIAAALTAKYEVVFKLLEGSPHADELYSEHERGAAEYFVAVETGIEEAIAGEMKRAGISPQRPLAKLLLASVYGIGRKTSAAEIGPAIRLITERLLRPELPARSSPNRAAAL